MPSTVTRGRARRLGRYPDPSGRTREVVCRAGSGGSLLVIDRDATTREEQRLVAHLGADEPAENATLVCEQYLRAGAGAPCRALTDADLCEPPFADEAATYPHSPGPASPPVSVDPLACLSLVETGMSIPELRWCRMCAGREPPALVPMSLRDAIAEAEAYEPLRTLSREALARHHRDQAVSTVALGAELARVLESPIVLNRRLREVVLGRVGRGELSMSEIAIRCGRVKRDRHGNVSGETSWLARRLGLLAEGGQGAPTRWIHSDVLALIARDGLGIAPREVELG